jgi:uncharacterized protein (TIGR03435 family)
MRISLPVLLTSACLAVWAQAPDRPSFEVASIHAAEPGLRTEVIGTDPGAFGMHNITLRRCIEWAYELNPNQLTGPAWLSDARFDITARAEDRSANEDKLHLMLQTMLADRFGLKVHRDRKEQQVFALTVARDGLKLHAAGAKDASKLLEATTEGPNSFHEDKTGAMAERVSMADIARKVSELLSRVVTDRTGLTGRYDLRLDLTPYMVAAADGGEGSGVDMASVLFTGFQEQLGLKLESGKDMVDLLVVDAVSKVPTDN